MQLAPGIHESLLRQIFALTQAARRGVRQGAEETLVTLHDTFEGIAITSEAIGHQLRIGCEFK